MSRREPLPFERLLAPIHRAGLLEDASGDLQTPIRLLAHDSRRVAPGACFFAIPGLEADGHLFLDKAVQHGATAAVCERSPEGGLPPGLAASARVTDSRAALAEAAAVFFGRPSQALRLLGVTGTNGKTTVAFLLHHLFQTLGEKTGLVGGVEVRIGDAVQAATHTTPDALALNALLREMADAGCSTCAMEVSSHAIHQERVRGQRFALAIFTNITHDHLDYHGSFEAYSRLKGRLFKGLGEGAAAVVNRDDGHWQSMVEGTPARVVTYGQAGDGPTTARGHHPPAGVFVEGHVPFSILENPVSGLRLRLDGEIRRFRLAGAFNAYNLAAAYAAARTLGYDRDEVLDALADAPPVPGRLETIRPADAGLDAPGPIAVVDYAHTPDALENVLRTVREMVPEGGSLSVVFGCGGDRDRAKRPVMGRLAERLADRVVLTNDNPRTEPPQVILQEVAGGMMAPPAAVLPDRAAAIRDALRAAGPHDVVVVAGKGHEPYQTVGTERLPFDDREAVREALREMAPRPS